jgi:hypothetical protein
MPLSRLLKWQVSVTDPKCHLFLVVLLSERLSILAQDFPHSIKHTSQWEGVSILGVSPMSGNPNGLAPTSFISGPGEINPTS